MNHERRSTHARRAALAAVLVLATAAGIAGAGLPEHVTVALPVSGIVLDGDLSDWPRGMLRLPIRNDFGAYGATDLDGVDLDDSVDLSPSFMVGYDHEAQLLYAGVEVRDDVLRNPPSGEPRDTDACEIYVSGLGGDGSGHQPLQYVMVPGRHSYAGYAGNPALKGGRIGDTRTRGAWRRHGDVTTYEWQIEVFDRFPGQPAKLAGGKVIGFDVVVDDDGPGIAAWVPWGPPIGAKPFADERIGRLVLGPEDWAAGDHEARQVQAFTAAWLRDHGGALDRYRQQFSDSGLQERLQEHMAQMQEQQAEVAARVAAGVARVAATAGAVAAAEARALEVEAVAAPLAPATWELVPRQEMRFPPGPTHSDDSLETTIVGILGACAVILVLGFSVNLVRRGGRGKTDANVDALGERIASIESRLTDTQDVMIALSEKLDRIDERADSGGQGGA